MKNLLILIALALPGLTLALMEDEKLGPVYGYHKNVGIPLAKAIFEAEQALNETGSLNNRVVNGSVIALGVHSFVGGLITLLTDGNISVCGSCLLKNTWSMTAAHCWNDSVNQGEEVTLVHGSLTLFHGGTRSKTKNVQVHENWNRRTVENDIAIINHPRVEYSDIINCISLPSANMLQMDFLGKMATISGYGRTSSDASGAITIKQILREINVRVISNTDCKTTKYRRYVKDTNICTLGVSGGYIGACHGDSGSAVTIVINGTTYVIGVASFIHSKNCSDILPNTHTRVTKYVTWLEDKMK